MKVVGHSAFFHLAFISLLVSALSTKYAPKETRTMSIRGVDRTKRQNTTATGLFPTCEEESFVRLALFTAIHGPAQAACCAGFAEARVSGRREKAADNTLAMSDGLSRLCGGASKFWTF